jgi:hypothetical protein
MSNVTITEHELIGLISIIDVSSRRGAWHGQELFDVGSLHKRLMELKSELDAALSPPAAAPNEGETLPEIT